MIYLVHSSGQFAAVEADASAYDATWQRVPYAVFRAAWQARDAADVARLLGGAVTAVTAPLARAVGGVPWIPPWQLIHEVKKG